MSSPQEVWSWNKAAQTLLVIAIAMILGNLIDQGFENHVDYKKRAVFFIFLQFLVIIAVVAALESIHLKHYPIPITSNIFFIAVFLGVQQNLWNQVSRIKVYPHRKNKASQPN